MQGFIYYTKKINKMKRKIFQFSSLVFLGLIFTGCSKDFVDLKPIASPAEATYYRTMASADKAITACYSTFCIEKVWDLTIMMTLGSISSDEAEAGAGGKSDVLEFQHIDEFTFTPSEANVFQWPWGYIYRTIKFCNVAIQNLPEISQATDPNFDAVMLKRRLGEAYFLRAFNYFTLCQIFGGVPLFDKVPDANGYNKPRSSIAEVYKLIKSDLQIAIASLPEKDGWGDAATNEANVGRASKGTALALMAKVFLYESSYAKYCTDNTAFNGCVQHWDSAQYYADQVITSGKYSLMGIDGTKFDTWRGPNTGGYQTEFMVAGNNSSEAVFEIQNAQDGLNWFDTRGTALVQWCTARKISPVPGSPGNGADFGWGWWCPSNFLISQYEPGDPRLKATVMTDQDSINCYKDNGDKLVWGYPNYTVLKGQTGLAQGSRKYECSYDEFWKKTKIWEDGPIHVKLIRYADVILFAAEAAFEQGKTGVGAGEAGYYLNMVRTRARNSGSTSSPANYTGAVTHDNIVHERLIELACEGHRFFDLVRWNLADQYLNTTLADGSTVEFIKGKNEFFPIPDKEIVLSNGVLTQYGNW
jgi:starch-binding outer membrane protein, SusD/RagB family